MSPGSVLLSEIKAVDLKASRRFCRRLATSHYENFLVASILLPRRIRQPFYNIYAFCRTADDVADESESPEIALAALQQLQQEIDQVFAGRDVQRDLFPALAETIQRFSLHKQPFDDLLSAFRQDQHQHDYQTTDQLLDYCTRSANPVGRLILQLGDALDDTNAALSDQICTGLQLANFLQDVARDHANGRIYLPADARQRLGVTPAMLAQSTTAPEVRKLLAELCDQTEAYFHLGLPLADHVPNWLSGDIRLFAHGGLATLRAIRRIGFDVLRVRPKVNKLTQFNLVARAMLGIL